MLPPVFVAEVCLFDAGPLPKSCMLFDSYRVLVYSKVSGKIIFAVCVVNLSRLDYGPQPQIKKISLFLKSIQHWLNLKFGKQTALQGTFMDVLNRAVY